MRVQLIPILAVLVTAFRAPAFGADAVANGAIQITKGQDPPISVGAGWGATTSSPPAFFWGTSPALDEEGAFTFTNSGTTLLSVTDDFCPGDQFQVFDHGVAIGSTAPVAISFSCPELGPAAAFLNPAYSHGAFVLSPGSHSITIQTITNPFGGGRAYLRVDTFSGSTDLLDSMSLLSGIKLVSDPTSPALTSNTAVTRIGVAADGVARLVVRFNAPASGTVAFSMVDTANNLSLASGPENGYLTDLSGNPPTTVPTVSNQGQRAFAVFIAPTRFVRAAFPSDAAVNQRQFSIQATFQSSGGNTPLVVTTAVVVVRPLVFLVHGLWTCKDSWTNFQPLISDQRFVTSRADYRDPPGTSCVASESFSASAATVYPQLKAAIQSFRASNNVAAIQADVVTHSMGGPVVRTMALQPTFLNDSSYPTFGVGPIHKLITIAGVHSGTPMANYLQSSLCLTLIFNSFNRPTMNGAVSDLETGSPAIAAIDGSAGRAFLANTVVGLASGAQVLANDSLFGGLVNFMCSATTPPFEFDLVLGTVNHDLMVPSSSQEASRSGPFSTVNGVVHSAPFLAPGGSQELLSSAIANQIIALLNANIDDPTMFAQF